jgi:hypothetical protein
MNLPDIIEIEFPVWHNSSDGPVTKVLDTAQLWPNHQC